MNHYFYSTQSHEKRKSLWMRISKCCNQFAFVSKKTLTLPTFVWRDGTNQWMPPNEPTEYATNTHDKEEQQQNTWNYGFSRVSYGNIFYRWRFFIFIFFVSGSIATQFSCPFVCVLFICDFLSFFLRITLSSLTFYLVLVGIDTFYATIDKFILWTWTNAHKTGKNKSEI